MGVSALKQLLEGGADLLDHVGGGGGAAVLVEGLPVALPGEGGGTECGNQSRVHTLSGVCWGVEGPVCEGPEGAGEEVPLATTAPATALLGARQHHVAVGDEVLLPLQDYRQVAHGNAELLGVPMVVSAVQRLLVHGLVESAEFHKVGSEDAFLIALDDRWLLGYQPKSICINDYGNVSGLGFLYDLLCRLQQDVLSAEPWSHHQGVKPRQPLLNLLHSVWAVPICTRARKHTH